MGAAAGRCLVTMNPELYVKKGVRKGLFCCEIGINDIGKGII